MGRILAFRPEGLSEDVRVHKSNALNHVNELLMSEHGEVTSAKLILIFKWEIVATPKLVSTQHSGQMGVPAKCIYQIFLIAYCCCLLLLPNFFKESSFV